ncbi:MAG: glycosyltransferase family 4 protein [Deltaproteobacteria bacterium]|nr:glycosyltransferase family 4 protein [Deltaproteobacteria bacterium]
MLGKTLPVENPIRILRIISRLNIGGPAIQAISLAKAFSVSPYLSLLVCGEVGGNEGDMEYLAKEMGVVPVLIPELGREISPARDIKVYRSLVRIIRDFRPDIIHTHTAKAGTLGRLAGLTWNLLARPTPRVRTVHTFHGHIFHSYFSKAKTNAFIGIERFLARYTDRIVVISSRQKEDICQKYRIAPEDKTIIIPLGFDLLTWLNTARDGNSLRERHLGATGKDTVLVGIVGRLTAVKNHKMLLDAMGYLAGTGKLGHFKFLIVGDGELRVELERYAEQTRVREYVDFVGWTRDMGSLYHALDVLVLTSLNEGTPVTLIEAMASGVPVIATDVGGVRDLMGVIDKETPQGYKEARHGLLVSPGDAGALGNGLVSFLEEPARLKARAEKAREFVLQRYTLERMVRDLDGLYRDLVRRSLSGQEG